MHSPTILLYGINGAYNYGCEAILRGTETIVREVWPYARIIYASPRPVDDQRRLQGSNIEIVSRRSCSRYSARNLTIHLCRRLNIPWAPWGEMVECLPEADLVLSIGGDLYTLYNEEGTAFDRGLLSFGNIVRAMGKPFVIWGASIGPFEKNPRAKRVFIDHLKGVDLITCREPSTFDYLASIGVRDNVIQCADPAFAMPDPRTTAHSPNSRPLIGINLSPLGILAGQRRADLAVSASRQATTVAAIVQELDADVLLVPHVICPFDEGDDDVRYLNRVAAALPTTIRARVRMLPADLGFMGTRNEITKCDVMIAARMHAAVNALGAGVPTILLAYSQKAVGMSKYIYGTEKWMLPLVEFTSSRFPQYVAELLKCGFQVRADLSLRAAGMKSEARLCQPAIARLCRAPV